MCGAHDEVPGTDVVAVVAVGYYRSGIAFNGGALKGIAEDDDGLGEC